MTRLITHVSVCGLLILIGSLQAATITVNDTGSAQQDDGLCTLVEAIEAVNSDTASGSLAGECVAGEAEDTILFDLMLPAVIVQPFMLEVNRSVTIEGPGMDLLSISGVSSDRILQIGNLAVSTFIIRGVSFSSGLGADDLQGFQASGGAVYVNANVSEVTFEDVRFENSAAGYSGGAVALQNSSSGTTPLRTFRRCHFIDNLALGNRVVPASGNTGGGGALYIGPNTEVLIEDSTFETNRSQINGTAPSATGESQGGAIWMVSANAAASSTLTVRRSTFSGNQAVGRGGAVAIGQAVATEDHSVVVMRHNTLTDNQADSNANDVDSAGGALWVLSPASVTLANNLIAGNITGTGSVDRYDVRGVYTSQGYNLIGDNRGAPASFPAGEPNANQDTVGAGPVNIIDPVLGALTLNGGPTPTHAPGVTSPAIDQGRCPSQTQDQRGYFNAGTGSRAVDSPMVADLDDGCDIGAFERLATSANAAPDAVDDSYVALEDVLFEAIDLDGQLTPGDGSDDGVLVNDIDPDSTLFVSDGGSFEANNLGGEVVLNADGRFSYLSPSNLSGLASFAYTASDGSQSDAATVNITVLAVNDEPSFTAASSLIELDQSAGPQSITAWATEINPGAVDESGQVLSFEFNVTRGGSFFSQAPAIDPATGTLTFTVADGQTGSAFFSVVLVDDGGTANGGDNRSAGAALEIRANSTAVNADLSISKGNGVDTVNALEDTTWTLMIQNSGPDPVMGVQVIDVLPPEVTQASWLCQANAQASCASSGAQSGDVSESLNLASGGMVMITIDARISNTASGTLVNTATLTLPDGVIDPTPGDLSSTDSDTLLTEEGVFSDGFEG